MFIDQQPSGHNNSGAWVRASDLTRPGPGWIAGGLIVASFGIPLLALAVGRTLRAVAPETSEAVVLAAIYGVGILMGVLGVRLLRYSEPFPSIFDEGRQIIRSATAIYGGVLIIGLSLVITFGNTTNPDRERTAAVVVAVGAAFVTPTLEEIWARGLVYRHLRAWLSPTADTLSPARRLARITPALLISSTVFGLSHYLVAPNVGQLVATIPVGIILGLAYEISGRLWVPIVSHTLLNASASANTLDVAYLNYAAPFSVVVAAFALGLIDKH